MLIDFLNALLPQQNKNAALSFKNTEQPGQVEADRKAIYDICCENENEEKFIVELQKAKQNFQRDREYHNDFRHGCFVVGTIIMTCCNLLTIDTAELVFFYPPGKVKSVKLHQQSNRVN